MGEVIAFRGARVLSGPRDAGAIAEQLIAELGPEAGYRIGCFARYAELPAASRAFLLRVADEIERRQGFGWWFADGMPSSAAQEP